MAEGWSIWAGHLGRGPGGAPILGTPGPGASCNLCLVQAFPDSCDLRARWSVQSSLSTSAEGWDARVCSLALGAPIKMVQGDFQSCPGGTAPMAPPHPG